MGPRRGFVVRSSIMTSEAAPPEIEPHDPQSGEARAPAAPRPGALRRAAAVLLFAAVYFVAGKLGLTLASVHPSATAIWPCTGIALAAILVFGNRLWPGVLTGAFLVNATTAGSLVTSLGIAAGNTLEAVVGALLVQRYAGGRDAFTRAPDTFRYAGLTGIACALSATLGVASLALTGYAPWSEAGTVWLTWWLGDMGGALLVAPSLLLWSRDWRLRWRPARMLEATALLLLLLVLSQVAFAWLKPITFGFSLKFLCVPPLIWAAYRFDSRTSAAGQKTLAAPVASRRSTSKAELATAVRSLAARMAPST